LELDFDALNRAINEAAECKVGGAHAASRSRIRCA
jgi:hypothetical protein